MLLRKLLRRSIVCISNEFEYLFIINEKGTPKLVFLFFGGSGERGIRTPGASQHDGFQDRCNRPLYHLSERRK